MEPMSAVTGAGEPVAGRAVRIVVIGGGFAGVWSAVAAARVRGDGGDGPEIVLVAPDEDLVLRPRLYEEDPDRARVPLHRVIGPLGVRHLRTAVTVIDTAQRRVVTADGTVLRYDRLVLAAGSELVRPELPGVKLLFDVDTLGGANRLAERLRERPGFTAVVVGSGFAGLEVATELAARGRVVLVERADVVGPELGPGPRPEIVAALDGLGVETRLGTTVTAVDEGGARLSDGTYVAADAVVWAAGLRASPLTAQVPGERDRLGRLIADRHLRVADGVYAAGDTVAAPMDAGHTTLQSCQHAVPLGKTAGHNAAADLLGLPLLDFAPGPYVTCLDLGAAGAVLTRGWGRRVESAGADGKRVKRWIMKHIEPPTDDAEALLAAAGEVYFEVPPAGAL